MLIRTVFSNNRGRDDIGKENNSLRKYFMNIEEQIEKRNLNSQYLHKQVDLLASICENLKSINRNSHLSVFEKQVVQTMYLVLQEMANEHRRAIPRVEAADMQSAQQIEKRKLLKAEAMQLLTVRTSGFSTANKVALLVFILPYYRTRGALTMTTDAKRVISSMFNSGLDSIADAAIHRSSQRGISLDLSVEEIMNDFDASREKLEKEFSGRIRAYEKQLAILADAPQSEDGSKSNSLALN